MNRLSRMVAIEDQAANLDWERDAVAKDTAAAHAAQWGDGTVEPDAGGTKDAGADGMRVMAGGNVTVNHHAAPVAPVAKPVVPPAAKPGMGVLGKLAMAGIIGASVMGTGGLSLALLPAVIAAFKPAAPATPPSANLLRDYDLLVGDPE